MMPLLLLFIFLSVCYQDMIGQRMYFQTFMPECYKYVCVDNMTGLNFPQCVASDMTKQSVFLNTSACNVTADCYINNYNGICLPSTSWQSPQLLYPGDACDTASTTVMCGFGPRT